jgi:hypothetical protein
MITFALGIDRYGLLVQQAGFMGTSLLGLHRTGLWPRWRRMRLALDGTSAIKSG